MREERKLNILAIIRPDQCGAIILLCVHKRPHQLTFKQSLVIISLRGLQTFLGYCFFLCHIQISTIDILFDQFKEFCKKLFAVSAK